MKTLNKINPFNTTTELVIAVIATIIMVSFIGYNLYVFFSNVTENTGSIIG